MLMRNTSSSSTCHPLVSRVKSVKNEKYKIVGVKKILIKLIIEMN